jgi:hypothetical protein
MTEPKWPTYHPCGCISRDGLLLHQCDAATLLMHNSLEAQRNGDMDLCHKLAAEYDTHIEDLTKAKSLA